MALPWFWSYYTGHLPPGAGFSMYGAAHLVWLAAIAAGIVLASIAYGRTPPGRQGMFRKAVAGLCLFLELGKQVILLVTLPAYPVDQLPLHLCGLGVFIQAIDAFFPRFNRWTREILYSLSLPGAFAALAFPDWTLRPLFNVYCIQSFLIHGVLMCYPIMLLAARQMHPSWKNLWRPTLFVLVVAGPIYLLNRTAGTNFLFINGGSPGSPLEFLEAAMGNPGYLVGYVGLVAVVWLFMYLPFILSRQARKAN